MKQHMHQLTMSGKQRARGFRAIAAAIRLAILILLGSVVAACSTQTAPPLTNAAAAIAASEYRLGLGDKVRVNVYGERELSGEFQVSGAGTINMPLVGNVSAVGKTAQELQDSLTVAYAAGYLVNPRVVVEVYDFRPFYILGEVEKPGQYPAREGLTMEGAIATAGGYSYRADHKRVFIRRAGEDREYSVDMSRQVNVAPGDVIRVGERHF